MDSLRLGMVAIPLATVKNGAMKVGINRNWTAAEDALLGTASDRNVARQIGVTELSVFNRRKRLGIPAFTKSVPPPPFPVPIPCVRKPRPKYFPRGKKQSITLPKAIDGKPIRDMTPDEYLAAAQLINRIKRS
jgi:hypothetical protein